MHPKVFSIRTKVVCSADFRLATITRHCHLTSKMTSLPPLTLGSEESSKLQSRIKVELAQRQWSEGEDDEVMAEYILVMLANHKTSEQIASELKDLIGESSGEGGTAERGVDDFVDWIWQERARIGRGDDVKMESLSSGTSEARSREQWRVDERRRRSLSPQERMNDVSSAAAATHPTHRTEGAFERRYDRRGGDRWNDGPPNQGRNPRRENGRDSR